MSSTVFEDIDDRLAIWILGNKDKHFFDKQIRNPLKEHRVIDPVDNMPIPVFRTIQHLVIVNCSFEVNNGSAVEYYYGNTDHHLYDFITSVLILLRKNSLIIKGREEMLTLLMNVQ